MKSYRWHVRSGNALPRSPLFDVRESLSTLDRRAPSAPLLAPAHHSLLLRCLSYRISFRGDGTDSIRFDSRVHGRGVAVQVHVDDFMGGVREYRTLSGRPGSQERPKSDYK